MSPLSRSKAAQRNKRRLICLSQLQFNTFFAQHQATPEKKLFPPFQMNHHQHFLLSQINSRWFTKLLNIERLLVIARPRIIPRTTRVKIRPFKISQSKWIRKKFKKALEKNNNCEAATVSTSPNPWLPRMTWESAWFAEDEGRQMPEKTTAQRRADLTHFYMKFTNLTKDNFFPLQGDNMQVFGNRRPEDHRKHQPPPPSLVSSAQSPVRKTTDTHSPFVFLLFERFFQSQKQEHRLVHGVIGAHVATTRV